jgi:hypothetical protein
VEPRYLQVSRRTMLTGLTGLVVAMGTTACGDGDEQAFGTPSGDASSESDGGGAGSRAAGDPVPASASMVVDFAFEAGDSRGPTRNPYIAVWIETPDERMVRTLSLWHLQQNERWLGELKRWFSVAEGDGSVSSATRVPGQYSVQWDCTDAQGAKVAAGEYFVCIEASREHGPYELIREPMQLAGAPAKKAFSPMGELTSASAAYSV